MHFSEALAKEAVWLAGLLPDDVVEEVFLRIGRLSLSDTSIWRRVVRWGTQMQAVGDAEVAAARALPQREVVVRGEEPSASHKGVAMDGVMVPIRDEGYKELKVGTVFEVQRPTGSEGGKETPAQAEDITYVGHLGGPQAFGNVLWAEASRRGYPRALDTIVLGDGAPWIWRLAQEHFSTSLQAIDWYHAKQHLYRSAHLAWGEGTPQAIRWAQRQETVLYQGHAGQVAAAIRALAEHRNGEVAHALRTEAKYFRRNRRRMQYLELRESGWPIGSGTVESGGKQFRARLCGPGMRWSREGAERMIPIRAAIMSRRFDDLWARAYDLAPNLN